MNICSAVCPGEEHVSEAQLVKASSLHGGGMSPIPTRGKICVPPRVTEIGAMTRMGVSAARMYAGI